MSRKNSIIFFIFIYLVTIAVLLKSAAPAVSGSAGLTAMLIESSLPCMEVVEASEMCIRDRSGSDRHRYG